MIITCFPFAVNNPMSVFYRTTIEGLDFSNIRRRLATDWPQARIDIAIAEYHKFLFLARCGVKVVPCPDVDRVWHDHILHTRQYEADCERVIGEFLHHTPSTGTVPEAEERSLRYKEMLSMYRSVFKQEPHAIWGECRPSIVANTRASDTFDGCDC